MIKLKEFSKFRKEPFSQFLFKKEVDVGFNLINLIWTLIRIPHIFCSFWFLNLHPWKTKISQKFVWGRKMVLLLLLLTCYYYRYYYYSVRQHHGDLQHYQESLHHCRMTGKERVGNASTADAPEK